MRSHPTTIFVDPTGRRRSRFNRLLFVVAVIFTLLCLAFLFSLLAIPQLPQVQKAVRAMRPLHRKRNLGGPASWLPALQSRAHKRSDGTMVVAAYYAPWQDSSLNSLRRHATALNMLMPVWMHLGPDGQSLNINDFRSDLNPHTPDVLEICARNQVKVICVLNNAKGSDFDPKRVHLLLSDKGSQEHLMELLLDFLNKNQMQGLQLDFENLESADMVRLPAFLSLLSQRLHKEGRALQTALEVSQLARRDIDWKTWIAAVDAIVLMDYDEHASEDVPGPVASLNWTQQVLNQALKIIPPEKLILGIGNYGYDWPLTKDPKTGQPPPGESLSYLECIGRAAGHPELVQFPEDQQNGTFSYVDGEGKPHEVWFLDAVSAANQWKTAQPLGLQGVALWVLGSADPSLWSFFDDAKLGGPVDFEALQTIDPPFAIDFAGQGEVLTVEAEPAAGQRTIKVDAKSGLAVTQTYQKLPSGYRIRRSGYRPKKVVLTFDDGPAPEYTEQILAVLKEFQAPGTFFVLGQNAERYPELLARIVDEGHELGNHSFSHPNLGLASAQRVELELTLTQRVFQSLVGRSSLLFRPPYNADAEPTSAEEVRPMALAARMGYLTIGELLDPEDWRLEDPLPDGTTRSRTAQDIYEESLLEVETRPGNCLLLHDGGGDRSATVEALRMLIPELRKRGYEIITLAALMGVTRDAIMPPVGSESPLLMGANRTTFLAFSWFQHTLSMAFILAIVLGAFRVFITTLLALEARRREASHPLPPLTSFPRVSVLIAAYNEARVIARTVESVLGSDYPDLEIIVVDDGSSDGTAQALAHLITPPLPSPPRGGDTRVRCLIQENTGKASALNLALQEAQGEIVFCIDADTLVDSQAISLLVRHFADPKVGAVAGNVKVGNRGNLITLWQSIEYITSQNLDRRGYAMLNAVPVVPGAIGAWRRGVLNEVGGYGSDTMAEDMDLTMRLRRAGYSVRNEPLALAFTEVPDNLGGLLKQRFRWAYGSLQCLWKHRGALGRYSWFGCFMLPSMWVFQIFTQLISPLVDVQILWALVKTAMAWQGQSILATDWQPWAVTLSQLSSIATLYLFFLILELVGAMVAFRMDKESPRQLIWLFTQRVVYRQLMYVVVLRSLLRASQGLSASWSKLERKGTAEKR